MFDSMMRQPEVFADGARRQPRHTNGRNLPQEGAVRLID
jgi:hypothetical protein